MLLCLITGLKSGLEKNAAGKKESYPGISIQSRWEELWKTVSSKDREEESESKDKTPEKDADPQRNIRVLIMTDGYQQIVHREVEISAAGGLRIEKKDGLEETAGNEKIKITKEDMGFQNGKIRIQAIDGGEITVRSIRRGYGNPSYAGALDLYTTSEGVVMVNELPLENYLCKVVPSEMPASYQKEALKAQAICARSYAYRQIMDYAYPEYQAHVNDSTDYQVYNNSASQQAASVADTFEGEFQKEERIDMSGKSEFYRIFFSILVLVVTVIITRNLIFSLICMNVVALLIILCLDASVAAGRVKICIVRDYRRVFVLFKVCLPLAISTFLSNYIINSSKLSVDRMLGDAAQLYYTAVFMPNMVINLFSGIIFKPMQTSMAVNYYEKKHKNFWHIIFRMFAIIAGFTLICEVGAYILGIPVLSWLYGVNLKDYKMTLLLLLLCGGVNAVNIIFYYVLAIMRKQKYMTILYLIVCGVALIIMDPITGRLGLNGAALGYLILVVLLGVLLMGYILYQIRKDRKRQ